MRFSVTVGVVLSGLALAGCGGGSSSSAPETFDVTFHAVADEMGWGCFNTPIFVGTTVVLKNETGGIVATGKTLGTPGKDACDFMTTVKGVPVSKFYVLENDSGVKLVTLASEDIQSGNVRLDVSASGKVSIGPQVKK